MSFVPQMPLNFSRLKHLSDSPRHFRAACDREFVESDAMRLGSATHCLIYEPEAFPDRFIEWTGGRRYGREFDEFRAEHEGKTILTPDQFRTALAIGGAARSHPDIAQWLADPAPTIEQRIFWTDPETGISLAGTPDYVGTGYLIDLKTTGNALPRQFAAYAARANYHAQIAMYRDGLEQLGCRVDECRWIVVESKPPYDPIPYVIPEHVIEEGRTVYRRWLAQILDCIADQRWPGRSPEPTEFHLPDWAYTETEPLTFGGQEIF